MKKYVNERNNKQKEATYLSSLVITFPQEIPNISYLQEEKKRERNLLIIKSSHSDTSNRIVSCSRVMFYLR